MIPCNEKRRASLFTLFISYILEMKYKIELQTVPMGENAMLWKVHGIYHSQLVSNAIFILIF